MSKFDDVKEPIQNNRYFGALFLLPILGSFILGGVWLKAVVALMGLRALYEFFTVVKAKGLKPIVLLGYAFGLIHYLLFFLGADLISITVNLILITVATLILSVFDRQYSFIDAGVTVLGYIYTIFFFSLIILIYEMPGGNWYVLTIFTISWLTDTVAYFTGRFYGRHKLIPEVSPKKTVEGAAGGLVGGAVGTMLYGLILNLAGQTDLVSPWHFLFMGFIGSIFAQIGDLIASAIKRDCGVKDYPKLIPGHGGILDRFDSVLLAAVSVFLYLTLFLGH